MTRKINGGKTYEGKRARSLLDGAIEGIYLCCHPADFFGSNIAAHVSTGGRQGIVITGVYDCWRIIM